MKLMQAYFDYAYNPVYDFMTGKLNRYRQLQERCISKLNLKNDDRILCVGVGTGNEILHILKINANVNIVGVDFSHTALWETQKKVLELGKEIKLLNMDAQLLQFPTGTFDKVLCIHVMDFVEENEQVTSEILRVLKDGGQFIITYPSRKEGPMLGINLLKEGVHRNTNTGKDRIRCLLEFLPQRLVAFVYLPLLFRPHRKSYSQNDLEAMITQLTAGGFHIEEDSVYQDFIVNGQK